MSAAGAEKNWVENRREGWRRTRMNSESTAYPGSRIHKGDLDSTDCHVRAYVRNTEKKYKRKSNKSGGA